MEDFSQFNQTVAQNLQKILTYEGDIELLHITFDIVSKDNGKVLMSKLKPEAESDIIVTNESRLIIF